MAGLLRTAAGRLVQLQHDPCLILLVRNALLKKQCLLLQLMQLQHLSMQFLQVSVGESALGLCVRMTCTWTEGHVGSGRPVPHCPPGVFPICTVQSVPYRRCSGPTTQLLENAITELFRLQRQFGDPGLALQAMHAAHLGPGQRLRLLNGPPPHDLVLVLAGRLLPDIVVPQADQALPLGVLLCPPPVRRLHAFRSQSVLELGVPRALLLHSLHVRFECGPCHEAAFK